MKLLRCDRRTFVCVCWQDARCEWSERIERGNRELVDDTVKKVKDDWGDEEDDISEWESSFIFEREIEGELWGIELD